jgi:hypothetical protein
MGSELRVTESKISTSGAENYWLLGIPPQMTRFFVFSNFGPLIIKLLIEAFESQSSILCME